MKQRRNTENKKLKKLKKQSGREGWNGDVNGIKKDDGGSRGSYATMQLCNFKESEETRKAASR
jgi:hypothetical protein